MTKTKKSLYNKSYTQAELNFWLYSSRTAINVALTHHKNLEFPFDRGSAFSFDDVLPCVVPAQGDARVYPPSIFHPFDRGGGISFHQIMTLQSSPFQQVKGYAFYVWPIYTEAKKKIIFILFHVRENRGLGTDWNIGVLEMRGAYYSQVRINQFIVWSVEHQIPVRNTKYLQWTVTLCSADDTLSRGPSGPRSICASHLNVAPLSRLVGVKL